MIGIAVTLAALTLVLWIFARKVIDKESGLSRQLNELRTELAEERTANLKRTEAAREAIRSAESQGIRLREETLLGLHELAVEFRNQMTEVGEQVRACSDRIGAQFDPRLAIGRIQALADELSARMLEVAGITGQLSGLSERVGSNSGTLERLSAEVSDLRSLYARLADMSEIMLHRPAQSSPIDQRVLRQRTESEMISLAAALATLRPLIPYPKWRFDADWSNPDLAFQLRQCIWQYFNDLRSTTPVVIGWHYGTRLSLCLGNDLSRQIYIAGCIDPNELAFLDRFLEPGMTFFDAGANEGVYSVFAAKRLGSEGDVWAFEPSGRELGRLRTNVELNGLHVRIIPVALAERSGKAELKVAGYEHEGQNTLGAFVYDIEPAGKEMIDLARLDDLVAQDGPARIDLIKIDVEGAEMRLFRGAAETLRRYQPVLLFEVSEDALRNQGSSRNELLDFLRDHGYTFLEFDSYSGLPTTAISGTYTLNMLGVPAGKTLPEAAFRPWPAGSK